IVMLICIILFSIGACNLIRAPKMLRPEAPPCFVRMEQLAGFLEASAGMIEGKAEAWTAARLEEVLGDRVAEERRCPEIDEPYSFSRRGKEWRICCPDETNHLGISDVVSCRETGGWKHSGADADRELQSAWWTLDREGGDLLVLSRHYGWPVWVAGILVALFLLLPLSWLGEFIRDAKRRDTWREKFGVFLSTFFLLPLFVFILFGPILVGLVYKPRYEIRSGGNVRAIHHIGSWDLSETTVPLESVLAVATYAESPTVRILYRGEEGLASLAIPLIKDKEAAQLASILRGWVLGEKPGPPR
ncbi:MAG: hypothetical protein O6952_08065, partial [Planctomycetota bacterium]|nr:hypothetical protein [Planctomycetota bacterium]